MTNSNNSDDVQRTNKKMVMSVPFIENMDVKGKYSGSNTNENNNTEEKNMKKKLDTVI